MRVGVGVGTGTGVCWIPLCPLTATPGVPFVSPAWPPTAAVGWRGVWSEIVTVLDRILWKLFRVIGTVCAVTPAGQHSPNVKNGLRCGEGGLP
jgi:hypothetical protein